MSYDGVEIDLDAADPPVGFHRFAVHRDIGEGAERFEAAKAAIADWAGHRKAGAFLEPDRPELNVGGVMALALRIFPLWVTASCRITEVFDDSERFGFTYATLPHHPASGEERFIVRHDPETDVVQLEVVAVSRPGSRLVRLTGPIGRVMQRITAGHYLDGFEAGGTPALDDGREIERPDPRPLSWRWWFENRLTGELTVAQSPNWPLFAIFGTWLVRWFAAADSSLAQGAGWLGTALWLFWGGDELLRGVNPWRRVLGTVVIVSQVVRILT